MDNRRLEYGGKMGIGYPAFLWEDQQMRKKKQQAIGLDHEGEPRADRKENQEVKVVPLEKVCLDVGAVEAILDQQVDDLIDIFGKKKFILLKELDQKLGDLKDDLSGNEIFAILYEIFNNIEQKQVDNDDEKICLGKKDAEKEEVELQKFLRSMSKKFENINKYDIKRYVQIKDIQSSKFAASLIFSTFGNIEYVLNFSRQIGITSTMIHILKDKNLSLHELKHESASFFKIMSKHFASLSGMIDKQDANKDEFYENVLKEFIRYVDEDLKINSQKVTFKDIKKYCRIFNDEKIYLEYCDYAKKMLLNTKLYTIVKEIEEKEKEIDCEELRLKDRSFSAKAKEGIAHKIENIKLEVAILNKKLKDKKHGILIQKGISPESLFRAYKNKYKKRSSK